VPYGALVASNIRKHLLAKHKIDVPVEPSRIQAKTLEKLQQLYAKAKDSGEIEEINNQVFLSYLNKDIVIKALVLLIVSNNLPYRLVNRLTSMSFTKFLIQKQKMCVTEPPGMLR
jgi:hypothetical protein